MAVSLGKFVNLAVVFLVISASMGNANATPTDDLVAAVSKADLEGMQKALQQGGDQNVLVCADWYFGFIYPSNSSECAEAPEKFKQGSTWNSLRYPLIWGVEKYFRFSPETALAMEKLLLSAGAKADTGSVNQNTGEIIKAGNYVFDLFVSGHGKGPQVRAERVLTFIKAGAARPTESELSALVHWNQNIGKNDEVDVMINSLEIMDSVDDSVSFSRCKLEFKKLDAIDGYQRYIEKYQANDSCGLVPKAKVKLAALVSQEKQRQIQIEKEMVAKAKDEAAAEKERVKAEKERVKAEKERVRLAAAQQAKERKQIAAFRKSIAEGEETNCGLAIEVKGKLVKVAFAVANYGNEHWIRRDQIFPSGYGCRFVNGQYQAPEM